MQQLGRGTIVGASFIYVQNFSLPESSPTHQITTFFYAIQVQTLAEDDTPDGGKKVAYL